MRNPQQQQADQVLKKESGPQEQNPPAANEELKNVSTFHDWATLSSFATSIRTSQTVQQEWYCERCTYRNADSSNKNCALCGWSPNNPTDSDSNVTVPTANLEAANEFLNNSNHDNRSKVGSLLPPLRVGSSNGSLLTTPESTPEHVASTNSVNVKEGQITLERGEMAEPEPSPSEENGTAFGALFVPEWDSSSRATGVEEEEEQSAVGHSLPPAVMATTRNDSSVRFVDSNAYGHEAVHVSPSADETSFVVCRDDDDSIRSKRRRRRNRIFLILMIVIMVLAVLIATLVIVTRGRGDGSSRGSSTGSVFGDDPIVPTVAPSPGVPPMPTIADDLVVTDPPTVPPAASPTRATPISTFRPTTKPPTRFPTLNPTTRAPTPRPTIRPSRSPTPLPTRRPATLRPSPRPSPAPTSPATPETVCVDCGWVNNCCRPRECGPLLGLLCIG